MLGRMTGARQRQVPECRPYQTEQVRLIHESWDAGHLRVLNVSATGSGKTTVSGFVLKQEIESGGSVLIVTDRKKLTRQFAHRTESDFGIPCGIEMAGEGHEGEQCVAATVQTITNRIAQGKFHPEHFSLLIFDEAHLSLSKGWQAVCSHFEKAKVLGLTATPVASQQKDLLKFFDVKVEPIDLKELIEQKWLSPIRVLSFPIEIKIEANSKTADFKDEDLSHAVDPYLESCAREMVKVGGDRCALAFLPLIKTSQKFCKILNEVGHPTEHVDGTMTEAEINGALHRLEMGKVKCLTSSMVLSVGVDCKPVNLILSLRPTKSWTLFVQQVGRGTRMFDPAKDGPKGTIWPKKDDLLVCDPLWLTDQHNLLQRPSVLFAKNEEEAERIDRHIRKGSGNLLEALSDASHEREELLRRRLEEMSKRKSRLVNPMEYFISTGDTERAEYTPLARWEESAPSPAQLAYLLRNDFDMEEIRTKGQAAAIISSMGERRAKGMATVKQCRWAESLGMRDAWTSSFAECSAYIDSHKPSWRRR